MKLLMSMALAIAKSIPCFGTFGIQFLLRLVLNPFSSIVNLCDGENLFFSLNMCISYVSREVVRITKMPNKVKARC